MDAGILWDLVWCDKMHKAIWDNSADITMVLTEATECLLDDGPFGRDTKLTLPEFAELFQTIRYEEAVLKAVVNDVDDKVRLRAVDDIRALTATHSPLGGLHVVGGGRQVPTQ